jgi:hypothetical protein
MQNQTRLSVVFLGFKSSHQVHDKQFHHLSKLLDHDFLWANICIVMMSKQKKKIEIFYLKCLVLYKKTKEILVYEKWSALFDYLEKFVITLLMFGKKKLFTIFLNLSLINAKSSYVCLASIPTYCRKLKKKFVLDWRKIFKLQFFDNK